MEKEQFSFPFAMDVIRKQIEHNKVNLIKPIHASICIILLRANKYGKTSMKPPRNTHLLPFTSIIGTFSLEDYNILVAQH